MAYKDVDVDIVVTPIVSYTDIANKPKLNGFELVGDVTLEDVGLGNVDNTSDLDKPISTAMQESLDLKADKSTTLSGYGIVDAYTKAEADSKYAEKTTIPTKLPNPEALTIKYNGQTAFTYDGSQSETGNFIVNAETVPMSADEQAITVKQELDKKVNVSDLSTVATTGSYNDLTDKPQSSGLQLKWFSKLSGVTLDISPIETSSVYKIYKNGLLLEPNVGDEVNDYSLSGTTITFTSELLDTDKITVEHTV